MTELTSLPQWRHCESGECVRVETVRTGPCPVTYLHSCASSTWTPGTLLLNDYDPLEHSTPHPDDDDVIQAEMAAWYEAQARESEPEISREVFIYERHLFLSLTTRQQLILVAIWQAGNECGYIPCDWPAHRLSEGVLHRRKLISEFRGRLFLTVTGRATVRAVEGTRRFEQLAQRLREQS